MRRRQARVATDQDGNPVFLADSEFDLRWESEKKPEMKFLNVMAT